MSANPPASSLLILHHIQDHTSNTNIYQTYSNMVTDNKTFSFYFATWFLAFLCLVPQIYCNPQLDFDTCDTMATGETAGKSGFGWGSVSKKCAEDYDAILAESGGSRIARNWNSFRFKPLQECSLPTMQVCIRRDTCEFQADCC